MIIETPFLTVQEYFELFKFKLPDVNISQATFNKYLSQTNTTLILKAIHKNLNTDNSNWKSQKLILFLANNLDNHVVKKKIENMAISDTKDNSKNYTSKMNLNTRNKSFLVKFFVCAGISYQIIAMILGMSKSYVKKLVYKESDFGQLLLSSIARYSGKVCVDEKFVKLEGKFLYIFSAVDKVTGIPLLVELFHEKTSESWQIFFSKFKKNYGNPSLIISDGCKSLAKGRCIVFPKVSFQFCKFHKIKNLIKKIYEYEEDQQIINKTINKLKQVFSRLTVGARRKVLLELETMIPEKSKEYFESSFLKEWKHLQKA